MKEQTAKRVRNSSKKKIRTIKKTEDTKMLIIGGTAVLLLGLGVSYYLYRRHKKKKEHLVKQEFPEIIAAASNKINTINPVMNFKPKTSTSTRFKCNSDNYPLKYGTCHEDVKILQKHLKSLGENLGHSGSNSDGIDGRFGNLTLKGAQKRLGKTTFSKSDIVELNSRPKMIKL